jgi:serine/threonine protein kinase
MIMITKTEEHSVMLAPSNTKLSRVNRALTANSADPVTLLGFLKASKNTDDSTATANRCQPLRPKQEIGPGHHRFRLLRKIGGGDQETVWLALDLSIKRDQNQLKLLKILNYANVKEANNQPAVAQGIANLPRIALGRLRARIERIARLNHPNIVQVYGWHQGEDGWPFIEIEYMDHRDGRNLDQILRRKSKSGLSWEQTLKLLKPIVAALDYAHSQYGLAHHNLKPANIFITRNGTVKVMDFDLTHQARPSSPDEEPRSTLLASSAAAQQRLKQDIIALAALIYEMLTGQPPCPPEAVKKRRNTRWPVLPGGRQSTEISALSSRVLSQLELQKPSRLTEAAWEMLQPILKRQTEAYPATLSAFIEQLACAQTQGDATEHPTSDSHAEPTTLLRRIPKAKPAVSKKPPAVLEPDAEIGNANHRFKLVRLLEADDNKQVWLATLLPVQPDNELFRVLKIILPTPTESSVTSPNSRLSYCQLASAAIAKPSIPEKVIAISQLLATLNHPNIAKVYGWHQGDEGWSFIEIEYMDHRFSGNLGQWLSAQNAAGCPWPQTLALLRTIAIALDYAHRKHGLAHRNLTPANIFITQQGEIKITDFDFDYQPLGFKKDIVALAALAYQLLTGQPPYQQDTLLGRDPTRWSAALVEQNGVKPIIPVRPLAEPIPPKPAALTEAAWEILQSILTHQNQVPFATAMEFVKHLNKAQSHVPPVAVNNTRQKPVKTSMTKHSMVSLVLAIFATAGAYFWVDSQVGATTHYPPTQPAVTAAAGLSMQQPLATSAALSNAVVQVPSDDNAPANPTSNYQSKRSSLAIQETAAFATIAELSNTMAKGRLSIGMSLENILATLGRPVRIVNEGGQLEEWIYREGGTKWIVKVRDGQLWQVSKVVLY